MAQIHGKPSRYLIWMDYGNLVAATCYFLILCWMWIEVFIFNFKITSSLVGFIAVVILFGPLAWFTFRQLKKHEKDAGKFYRGRLGEAWIRSELSRLPISYAVFQGVKNNFGDIDFIVVGPTGVFTVEAKSTWGLISLSVLHSVKIFGKDILVQSRGEAVYIHNFIFTKIGKKIWANPILVFSSPWAKLKFWLKPIEGVQVVQRALLNKAILDGTGKLSDAEVLELESIFVKVLEEQERK